MSHSVVGAAAHQESLLDVSSSNETHQSRQTAVSGSDCHTAMAVQEHVSLNAFHDLPVGVNSDCDDDLGTQQQHVVLEPAITPQQASQVINTIAFSPGRQVPAPLIHARCR